MSHSTECFCGNVIPEESVKLSDPQCNYKCSGDAKQLCGGYFTISIFETGIKSNSVRVLPLLNASDDLFSFQNSCRKWQI